MLIAENHADDDPDRIDALALKVLLQFETDRPLNTIDLMVIDSLRLRASEIRNRRAC